MDAISLDPRLNPQRVQNYNQRGVVVDEEIVGLIRVYKDGHIDRPLLIPNVSCSTLPSGVLHLTAKDVTVDKLWARFYVPNYRPSSKLPLLVYFHGGGFCVGSASWSCYHEFLAKLACKAGCMIMSVNYHLAPENRLPTAYDDGVNAIMWVRHQAIIASNDQKWWASQCNFSSLFLAGDSAGANIAHHVAIRLVSATTSGNLRPLFLKGTILIQPFFGGEARTESEKHYSRQPPHSALTLSASDTYWRLSLPVGANRDHPWCNPLARGAPKLTDLSLPPTMICISDIDILKDRNLKFCDAMTSAGKQVKKVIYEDVGHAFQVLHNYPLSQTRTHEMMSHLKAFITTTN